MAAPIRKFHTAAFFSTNETDALTVGTASANVALSNTNTDLVQALFVNVGANVVYINLGTDNTVTAGVPASGTPASGIPLLPNSALVLAIGTATYVAAIAAAAGNTLFVTVGSGGI